MEVDSIKFTKKLKPVYETIQKVKKEIKKKLNRFCWEPLDIIFIYGQQTITKKKF